MKTSGNKSSQTPEAARRRAKPWPHPGAPSPPPDPSSPLHCPDRRGCQASGQGSSDRRPPSRPGTPRPPGRPTPLRSGRDLADRCAEEAGSRGLTLPQKAKLQLWTWNPRPFGPRPRSHSRPSIGKGHPIPRDSAGKPERAPPLLPSAGSSPEAKLQGALPLVAPRPRLVPEAPAGNPAAATLWHPKPSG